MVGGTIAQEDFPRLKKMGIDGISPLDSKTDLIVKFVKEKLDHKEVEN